MSSTPNPRTPPPESPSTSSSPCGSNRSANSTNSITSSATSTFSNAYPSLPPTGAITHAHILDLTLKAKFPLHLNTPDVVAVQLQDAIVTTLFLHSADTLSSFLSPRVGTFKAIFGTKKDAVQLVVWRKGVEVLIALFAPHPSLSSFSLPHLAGCMLGFDGTWHLKITAGNAWCASKWADVWAGKMRDGGGIERMKVEVDEVGMRKRGVEMAGEVLGVKFWMGRGDVRVS